MNRSYKKVCMNMFNQLHKLRNRTAAGTRQWGHASNHGIMSFKMLPYRKLNIGAAIGKTFCREYCWAFSFFPKEAARCSRQLSLFCSSSALILFYVFYKSCPEILIFIIFFKNSKVGTIIEIGAIIFTKKNQIKIT